MKVPTVPGARAEAFAMDPIVKALRADPVSETEVSVAAQHCQIFDQMQPCQDINDTSNHAPLDIREVYQQWIHDLILGYGNAASTLARSKLSLSDRPLTRVSDR